LRLFVVNPSGDAEDKDNELVFINPTIRKRKGQISGEEGCLSLPGLYADVVRAEEIVVEAFDLNGQPFRIKLDELPARVIQHENDHLDGVMFIDRLDDTARAEVSAKVAEFMSAYTANRKEAGRQTDDEICEELKGISTKGYLPGAKAPA
jgi:peptide deformylase